MFWSVARKGWRRWRKIARAIGNLQARLLLSFFYFVILSLFALALRRWADPLAIKNGAPGGWRPRSEGQASPRERATRQY